MEKSKKNEALFSHVDDTSADSSAENKKPAVYSALFSGENTAEHTA